MSTKQSKRLISARLSDATIDKLHELAERYGTQTTVIEIALDRMYREEIEMNDRSVTVKPIESDELHPLYRKYPRQVNPQQAYLEYDRETRELYADWNAQIGSAVPIRVWQGRLTRFTISPHLTADEINELMEEVAAYIAQHGHPDEYDLYNDVDRMCAAAQTTSGGVIEAEDWLGPDFDMEDYPDRDALITECYTSAAEDEITIFGLEEYLAQQ